MLFNAGNRAKEFDSTNHDSHVFKSTPNRFSSKNAIFLHFYYVNSNQGSHRQSNKS